MALSLHQKIENAFNEYQGRWFFGSQIHRDIMDEIDNIPEDDIAELSLAFYYLTNYTLMATEQLSATEQQTRESLIPETEGIYKGNFIREDYFPDEIRLMLKIQKVLSYTPEITDAFKRSALQLFEDINHNGWLAHATSLWPNANVEGRLVLLKQFLQLAEFHLAQNGIHGTESPILSRDDLESDMACYTPDIGGNDTSDTLHILTRTAFVEEEDLVTLLSLTLHEKVHLNLAVMALEISDHWVSGHGSKDDFNFPDDSAISYFIRKYKIASLSSQIMSVYLRNPEEKLAYGTQKVFQEKAEAWLATPLQAIGHNAIAIP